MNLMSARAYGEFEFWFSSIKVAAIVSFIVVVGAHAFGYRSTTGPTFSTLSRLVALRRAVRLPCSLP